MKNVFEWLKEINDRYPAFDSSKWTPPSLRSGRKDKVGLRKRGSCEYYEYRNFQWSHQTKTWWYEMKAPNQRWSGPFHGRLMRDFNEMEIV